MDRGPDVALLSHLIRGLCRAPYLDEMPATTMPPFLKGSFDMHAAYNAILIYLMYFPGVSERFYVRKWSHSVPVSQKLEYMHLYITQRDGGRSETIVYCSYALYICYVRVSTLRKRTPRPPLTVDGCGKIASADNAGQ